MGRKVKSKGPPVFNPESPTARMIYGGARMRHDPPKLARYVRRGLFLPAEAS